MSGLVHSDGRKLTQSQAQEKIKLTIERMGYFFLSSDEKPKIGEVQMYAGLPMRAVRHLTYSEAKESSAMDIWESYAELDPLKYHFEVEVAD